MVTTASHLLVNSAGVPTASPLIVAARSRAFSGVRFQTNISWPAFARLRAIRAPIRPSPAKPTRMSGRLVTFNAGNRLNEIVLSHLFRGESPHDLAVIHGNNPVAHVQDFRHFGTDHDHRITL